MDLAIKQIISTLLLLPASPLLLATLGIWLLWRSSRAQRQIGLSLLVVALVTLWVASTEGLVRIALRQVEAPWKPYAPWKPSVNAPAQAVVVLGGGRDLGAHEYGGAGASSASVMRLRYGIHIARPLGLPVMFTGGSGEPGVTDAPELSEASLAAVTAERDLRYPLKWVEGRSRDTAENARLSAALLKPRDAGGLKTVVLVSDAWHMPRAVRWFEREGFVVQPAPMGFKADHPLTYRNWLPSAEALATSNRLLREQLGQAWQALR